ncbi:MULTISPECIES: hypothetical protein [Stigmatella]|nr:MULTISPECIES: hypothetical protein [Stigmatella]
MRLDDGRVEGTQGAPRKGPSEGGGRGGAGARDMSRSGSPGARGEGASESTPRARAEHRKLQDFLNAFV